MINDINFSISLGTILSYGYLLALLVFLMLIWKISKNPTSKFNWIDLISNSDGTASLTRSLQLIAGFTGTWVIIKMTVAGTLSLEFFVTYLGALGASEAFNKWLGHKYEK